MKKRIYIAGKLSDPHLDYLKNVYKMVQTAEQVRRAGFSVYVPGLDLLQALIMGDLEYSDLFNNSQPWLEVSDAVFLVPGWGTSEGTKKEIAKATMLGIPIFEDLEEMKEYFEQEK